MIISESRKLVRKFLVLAMLLAGLGLLSAGVGTNAATNAKSSMRPCCSVCDPDPTIPICQYGCTEGCRAKL
jgi:hypothetical protein